MAWVGWQMRIPPEWRPLRIEGGWDRGAVIVGDMNEPVLQLKWWRPGKKRFDADRWVRRRLRSLRARSGGPEGPSPKGFSHTAWVPESILLGAGEKLLRFWYGYAPAADLVVEVSASPEAAINARKEVMSKMIPSISVYGRGDATRWAVFGASFESPAGFRMINKRLLLGDLALLLAGADGSRLMLRQVYPAELALGRRNLERWVKVRPFKEHRKYRLSGLVERYSVNSFGRTLEGIRQWGRKRLPIPLGFCAPRVALSIAVQDQRLDRLLLAEHDAPSRSDEIMLATAVGRMNWDRLQPGGTS